MQVGLRKGGLLQSLVFEEFRKDYKNRGKKHNEQSPSSKLRLDINYIREITLFQRQNNVMSGIEVAGLVLGAIPLAINALKNYHSILSMGRTTSTRNKAERSRLRSELMLQRARLETSLQKFNTLDTSLSNVPSDLGDTFQALLADMSRLLSRFDNPSTMQSIYQQEYLNVLLQQISGINDALELTLQLGSVDFQTEHEAAKQSISEQVVQCLSAISGEEVNDIKQRFKVQRSLSDNQNSSMSKSLSDDTPALRHLVTCCCSLLRQYGTSNPDFVELSNLLQLWHHGIATEGIYDALKETSLAMDSQKQLLMRLLTGSVIRLMQILLWWRVHAGSVDGDPEWRVVVEMCSTAVLNAHNDWDWIPSFNPEDIIGVAIDVNRDTSTEVNAHHDGRRPGIPSSNSEDKGGTNTNTDRDRAYGAVMKSVKLLIDNMVNCLPSIIIFIRQQSLEDSDISAADVAQLLDITVRLIEPASQALEKAKEAGVRSNKQPEMVTVDFESIQNVFEEQTRALRAWKSKHREDVEAKLADRNPAKLASVADTIGNLATILAELPASLEKDFEESDGEESLGSRMKMFESYTQSLVTIGEQLEHIAPPPAYAEASKDRVIIDLSGRLIVD